MFTVMNNILDSALRKNVFFVVLALSVELLLKKENLHQTGSSLGAKLFDITLPSVNNMELACIIDYHKREP